MMQNCVIGVIGIFGQRLLFALSIVGRYGLGGYVEGMNWKQRLGCRIGPGLAWKVACILYCKKENK